MIIENKTEKLIHVKEFDKKDKAVITLSLLPGLNEIEKKDEKLFFKNKKPLGVNLINLFKKRHLSIEDEIFLENEEINIVESSKNYLSSKKENETDDFLEE